jgi:RNA polymerase sigma-70 factor (ECF subfamily)
MSTAALEPLAVRGPLVTSARAGDEEAFRRLVEAQRPALHSFCYRMLGSFHDAEDALQETMLRIWRGLPRYEGRSALSTWLYRIATNVCLDAIGRRPKRLLPIDGGAPGEQLVSIEPYADEDLGLADGAPTPEDRYEQREALERALIAAIQHLPTRQRAVLLLREVLGFSAKEVSEILGSTVASTNSSLQRARSRLGERLSEPSPQATARSLGDVTVREAVDRLVDAFERGDVDAIVRLLAGDEAFAAHARWRRRRSIADRAARRRPRTPRDSSTAMSVGHRGSQ